MFEAGWGRRSFRWNIGSNQIAQGRGSRTPPESLMGAWERRNSLRSRLLAGTFFLWSLALDFFAEDPGEHFVHQRVDRVGAVSSPTAQ
jgi:hypothetical protein